MQGVSARKMIVLGLMFVLALGMEATTSPSDVTTSSDHDESGAMISDYVTSSETDQLESSGNLQASTDSESEAEWSELDHEAREGLVRPRPIRGSPRRPKLGEKKKKGCTKKCTERCVKSLESKVPLMISYCKKSCNMQCELRFMDHLYRCTIECANSMPRAFKKDPRKAERYVEQCDIKCMKKHK